MAASDSGSKSLKEYLKRYESNTSEEALKKKKKKKMKKAKAKPVPTGVLLMDEDPVWQKPLAIEEENENDSDEEERPQVNEDIEVKRMRRLEEISAKRAYNAVSEDGSGWVSLTSKQANLDNLNSDLSPPRRGRDQNDMLSPEQIKPGNESVDFSPPRRGRARNDTSSPERRRPRKDAGDLSPPRRGRARNDTPSPERRQSGKEPEDFSPPRRGSARNDTPLPDKKWKRVDEVDDLSPPRRRQRDSPATNGSDLSPPRKSRNDDLSPPRRAQKREPIPATKEQRKTGLIIGQEMRDEIAKTKKQDAIRYQNMDPSVSGRNAKPIFRDKMKGERISKEEFLKSRQKVKEKPKEIKLEWGKGLAQKWEAEAKLQELELEKDKPFARTRDDPDLDRMLKDTVRWGDPMAHLAKKKQSETVLPNLGDNEKMKESGFIIPQEIPSHSWIKRGMEAAFNRYGIKPGRHWDGIDRSNGYEKELFKRTNEKQATEREAYLWSVSDM